jgi:exosortase
MANHHIRHAHAFRIPDSSRIRNGLLLPASVAAGIVVVTAWSYWATITDLFKEWQSNADYSAGQLVPLVALFLLWHGRKRLGRCDLKPSWILGITLLLLAQAGRFFGLLFMFESAERYSLVLSIAALVLMVAGRQVFRAVSWILLFLILMVPLPGRVHNLISGPLQNTATAGSVFVLEAVGPHVSRQGNVVMLNDTTPMAVAEACSGLRMLTAFVIVTAFVAYMVKRPRWQKAVLFFSSIPIAVVCNILRLCVTAVLFVVVDAETGRKFFHDFAGLVMMPTAALLLFAELWLMNKLVVPEPETTNERGAA